MIVAVLNDLLFASKIRTTARQLGVDLTIVKSADASATDAIRAHAPSLVILDLNNPAGEPIEVLSAMQDDPVLSQIPTVAFASHVQTELIQRARRAGAREVLPRSAFAMRLGEILSGA
jgi:CheY-like chemotaxis protein